MPSRLGLSGKAPWFGAFFVLVMFGRAVAADPCAAPADAETVKIQYVHDGDTLVLANNRKIRLIGINTPEAAQQGQPPEALAIQARDSLRQLLFQSGNQARIKYGPEARDRHGRFLAHLWLPQGDNLAASLLDEGLGWVIAIPPNVTRLDCYTAAESRARQAGRGVWKHPAYAIRASNELGLREKGFQRVTGRITRVNRGGAATWINLQGKFAVRIPDNDLKWFVKAPDRSWIGDTLEVRGWLYRQKGELRVNVHHPAALERITRP